MKTMNSIAYICANSESIHATKEERYAVVVHANTEVTYGFDDDCDTAYCQSHNVPCYDRNSAGGCIVHTQGNLDLTLLYPHSHYPEFLSEALLRDFVKYLEANDIAAEIEHNDVLIDGYKVASAYDNNIGPDWLWCKTGFQISVNQDLELISHVCKKPMVKVPKGLSEYGLTTANIVGWVESWLAKNFPAESV